MAKDPNSNRIVVAYNSTKIDIVERNNIHSILDLEREILLGVRGLTTYLFTTIMYIYPVPSEY